MFQFPGLSSPKVCVPKGDACTAACGFAHSETPGSSGVCPYPGIIAACRVLHRLPVPRHPPRARDIFSLPSDIRAPGASPGAARTYRPGLLAPATRCSLLLPIYKDRFDQSVYMSQNRYPFFTLSISLSNRISLSPDAVSASGLAMRLSRYAGRPRGPDAAGDSGRPSGHTWP